MANALRCAFIGIPFLLARESLRAVCANSELVGIAESKPSYWQPPSGGLARYRSGFTYVARRRKIDHLLIGQGEPLADWLARLKPDLLCVTGMTRLLTSQEFQIPRLGSINLHPSLLPRYRGPDPFYWQYHDHDRDAGVTIHFISADMDEGAVLVQTPFTIGLGDPLNKTIETAAALGGAAMGEALRQVATGTLRPRLQDASSPTAPARFVPRGEIPRDWLDWPLDRVWHFLRGTHVVHPFLPVPFGLPSQWRIGDREASSPSRGAGTIQQDGRGFFLTHPAGRIELLPPLSWTLYRKLRKRVINLSDSWRWRL